MTGEARRPHGSAAESVLKLKMKILINLRSKAHTHRRTHTGVRPKAADAIRSAIAITVFSFFAFVFGGFQYFTRCAAKPGKNCAERLLNAKTQTIKTKYNTHEPKKQIITRRVLFRLFSPCVLLLLFVTNRMCAGWSSI